jgi:hypothetical protein
MPALAVDDQHAAFYSAPHAMEEGTLIEYACATAGRKDGEPFVHCHAIWRGRDGQRQGGHLMMEKPWLAQPPRKPGACTTPPWRPATIPRPISPCSTRPG